MRILSYRGPCAPGGVSGALTQIFDKSEALKEWYFIKDSRLNCISRVKEPTHFNLDAVASDLHYKYSNNFLWPIVHDLPEFARYSADERQHYRWLNAAVAAEIRANGRALGDLFVNDYQFALVPRFLADINDTHVFWHIPWPRYVSAEHLSQLSEVASGLLHAKLVGFHTQEYLDNFRAYVEAHNLQRTKFGEQKSETKFVVAPLGLDFDGWNLANFYRHAAVLLVTPLRDGLNLTAKEFVACQQANPGTLGLSPEAGVWTEIGQHSVSVRPENKNGFASSLAECLSMSETERYRRHSMLKERLRQNTLSNWWRVFRSACDSASSDSDFRKVCCK